MRATVRAMERAMDRAVGVARAAPGLWAQQRMLSAGSTANPRRPEPTDPMSRCGPVVSAT